MGGTTTIETVAVEHRESSGETAEHRGASGGPSSERLGERIEAMAIHDECLLDE